MKINIYFILMVLVFAGCTADSDINSNKKTPTQNSSKKETTSFKKVNAQHSGVKFINKIEEDITTSKNPLIYEYLYNGGGVGLGDINNDGLLDIYMCGNMVADKLYLNKGNLQFEDITAKAGITGNRWSTGVNFIDINNDGLVDVYVCQGGTDNKPELMKNLLYINKGDNTFINQAEKYGLADNRHSIQSVFLDYDNDGDLDCLVANNGVLFDKRRKGNFNPNEIPENFANQASCSFYKNNGNNTFSNVTKNAGIEKFSYALGVGVSDFNNDGWQDFYIANDYAIPDFLFINNQNGTFTESVKEYTKQVPYSSMGLDIADINNDGLLDIGVVEMSSKDHFINKTTMPSMNLNLFFTLVDYYKYQHQYMFNAIQLNTGNGFSNIGQLSNMASTEWSWSILFADFDNDADKDCYISNGIKKYMSDRDFLNRVNKLTAQNKAERNVSLNQFQNEFNNIPVFKTNNKLFRNNNSLQFEDISKQSGIASTTNSSGAAYGDLDNDGDLDVVTNNVDAQANIFENIAKQKNYLQVQLPYNALNTKVEVYTKDVVQTAVFQPVRGFQSASEPRVHIGLANSDKADSLRITFPNGKQIVKYNVKANTVVKPLISEAKKVSDFLKNVAPIFTQVDGSKFGVNFKHTENKFTDYKTEVLLPYLQSTLGPKVSVADFDGNGLDDFYIGGASNQSGALYKQVSSKQFIEIRGPWQEDSESEDMGSTFFDADNDGDLDLYVCSGGNEFQNKETALQDRLYINNNGEFSKGNLPKSYTNSMAVCSADFDADGDKDLFVGSRQIPGKYPIAEGSFLLLNDNGKFKIDTSVVAQTGMVNSAIWNDIDNDNDEDLIVAAEWGEVSVFENKNGKLVDESTKWGTRDLKGWWFDITPTDLDNDGDTDFVVGNLGLNSKFKASKKTPFLLFAGDFDKNGTHDLFLSKYYKNKYVPVRGKECSSEQMPLLNDKYSTFKDFANASVNEILNINDTETPFETNTFESGILENIGGSLKFKALPIAAQIAPILGSVTTDYNKDGLTDLIIADNLFNTEVETPRLDAGKGCILKNYFLMKLLATKLAST